MDNADIQRIDHEPVPNVVIDGNRLFMQMLEQDAFDQIRIRNQDLERIIILERVRIDELRRENQQRSERNAQEVLEQRRAGRNEILMNRRGIADLEFALPELPLDEIYRVERSAEIRARIEELRRENEQSSRLRFLRKCHACECAEPPRRVLLTTCGHAVCSECADKHSMDGALSCPTCKSHGGFVHLFENDIGSESGNGESRFSRDCEVCLDTPHQRALFTSCGHLLCLACAEQLNLSAREQMRVVRCPMCNGRGGWRRMDEETEDTEDGVGKLN